MKLTATFIILLFFASTRLCAQDIIYKYDSTRVFAKIISTTKNEIHYRLYPDTLGVTYILPISTIVLVEYENGGTKVYHLNYDEQEEKEVMDYRDELRNNILSINYLDIMNGNLNISYERILAYKHIGLKLGVNKNMYYFNYQLGLYSHRMLYSAEFTIYPGGQKKWGALWGPCFRWGRLAYAYKERGETKLNFYRYTSTMLSIGGYMHATPRFMMSVIATGGVAGYTSEKKGSHYSTIDGALALTMGWRF